MRTRQSWNGVVRYDVRYRVNGEERSETFRRKSDAEKRLTRVRADELAGLVIDPLGGERLFGEYANEWLKHRLVKGRPLTPATRQGYEALLRRNLRPTFAKTKLRQITPERVRKWHAELTAGKGADQAAKSYRLLRAILTTAARDGLIAKNPCVVKGAGIEHAAERPMLDTSTVLALAEAITPRLRCLVLLAGFVTLRPGELLGLERRDIDLLHGTVTVERQAHEITGQGRIFTAPKTEAGERTLALPGAIREALNDHLDAYVAPEPDAPMFTRPSGLPLRRSDLSNAWKDACAVVGLKGVHPHDLRHHAGTMMAHKPDVTLKELMAAMGHASPAAALRYQHATEKRNRELADFLDKVITAARKAPKTKIRTIGS
jgi:integrase